MTIALVAMLAGLFLVPAGLLWLGHRLRRRTPRQRAIFWGALVGYGVAAAVALVVSMLPAEMWSDADRLRGLLGYWGMLIGPAIGVAIAGLKPVSPPSPR
jgi:hypothetical protein